MAAVKNKYYILNENGFFDLISLNAKDSKFGKLREIQIIDGENIYSGEPLAFKEIVANDGDKSSSNKTQLKKFAKDLLQSLVDIDDSTMKYSNLLLDTTFKVKSTETISSILGTTGVLFIHYKNGSLKILNDEFEHNLEAKDLNEFLKMSNNKYELERDITGTNPGKALIKVDPEINKILFYNVIT